MSQRKNISRREFLGKTAGIALGAAGFPYIISSSALGKNGAVAASERITMGVVGTGGMGTVDLRGFLTFPDVRVLAVCDVERKHREDAKGIVDSHYGNSDCAQYNDFRGLLAREDIDAVLVTTPDHWHGLVSVAAAKAGKDIYCEKPLANSIMEGRAICEAVKRYGRVLQTGSHERSNDSVRFACELVCNGRIGKLHTIRINLPLKEPHHAEVLKNGGVQPMPIPDGFDYDMWLGHTPYEPYTERRCHFWWRFILDYGGGEITDRGAHIIDIAQLGNGSDNTGPIEIEAQGQAPAEGIYNTFMKYKFECKYANGVRMVGGSEGTRGLKFEGSDGWVFIHIHGGNLEAEPASLLHEVTGPNEIHLGRSCGHHRDFLNAVKTRGLTIAPAEVGHRTASICHLLNIAMLSEQKLKWDPDKEQIINSSEASRMLTRSMRSPWHL